MLTNQVAVVVIGDLGQYTERTINNDYFSQVYSQMKPRTDSDVHKSSAFLSVNAVSIMWMRIKDPGSDGLGGRTSFQTHNCPASDLTDLSSSNNYPERKLVLVVSFGSSIVRSYTWL